VKPEGRPAASVKPGKKSCVIKSKIGLHIVGAEPIVKHPLKGDPGIERLSGGKII
jgi:hypothetical protein